MIKLKCFKVLTCVHHVQCGDDGTDHFVSLQKARTVRSGPFGSLNDCAYNCTPAIAYIENSLGSYNKYHVKYMFSFPSEKRKENGCCQSTCRDWSDISDGVSSSVLGSQKSANILLYMTQFFKLFKS
ncbi:hypothetical protein LOAG_00989 [Loa loa]|uniref:Uncharacterized protein n=1 Tax=Loa loa TaxID=7209 RepID=A0A1S0UAR7_LOALO|nr:hypothetical protein LOAG_00989 [Loa loa]EFO27497.1 hypothetical protein LOAG_00989 [Loa loa]